eukprot:1137210-Pelagomonas_calceolata.AAC.6
MNVQPMVYQGTSRYGQDDVMAEQICECIVLKCCKSVSGCVRDVFYQGTSRCVCQDGVKADVIVSVVQLLLKWFYNWKQGWAG